jgi:serine protease Do
MSSPRVSLVAAASGLIGAAAAVFVLEARRGVIVGADQTRILPAPGAGDPSNAFREVAKLLRPSVVNLTRERIVTEEPDPLTQMFERYNRGQNAPRRNLKESLQGTGFVVTKDGLCLTNNHVAGGGGKLTARLADGKTVAAEIVAADPDTDVAVVRLAQDGGPYTPVALGDSEAVEVGDWALAFGCPFGLEQTMTVGVISAKGRSHVGVAAYEDFLQTDAAINPGNSGGPLVDIRGRVIGINTAIASRSGGYQGVGFTIPINMAKAILDQLLKSGHVVRGWLGVKFDPQDETRAGAPVKAVTANSPAEKAGLKAGDVITSYDGHQVEDGFRLRLYVAETPVGKTVPMKVQRDGKDVELTVTIAELTHDAALKPTVDERPRATPEVGITAKKLTPELAAKLGLAADATGVVVAEVAPGSLAEKAGVKAGQLIRSIDGKQVASMADLNAAVSAMDLDAGVKVVLEDASGRSTVLLQAR